MLVISLPGGAQAGQVIEFHIGPKPEHGPPPPLQARIMRADEVQDPGRRVQHFQDLLDRHPHRAAMANDEAMLRLLREIQGHQEEIRRQQRERVQDPGRLRVQDTVEQVLRHPHLQAAIDEAIQRPVWVIQEHQDEIGRQQREAEGRRRRTVASQEDQDLVQSCCRLLLFVIASWALIQSVGVVYGVVGVGAEVVGAGAGAVMKTIAAQAWIYQPVVDLLQRYPAILDFTIAWHSSLQ